MSQRKSQAGQSAFTLIELLVVIAIIAILAAILFPVFARAKVSAKQTQDLSNLKNINTATQIYLSDYDDRWPVWSTGKNCLYAACTAVGTDPNYDDGSAFGLRYMYPQIINPYVKSGISGQTGQLNDIWASPLSKSYFPNTKYLYAYNYYGLGGFSGCDATNAPASCGSRSATRWGIFANAQYNSTASATEIANPAGTLAFADGNILCRAPQFVLGNSGADSAFIAIWGPADPGDGKLFNADGSQETVAGLTDPSAVVQRDIFTAADLTLLTGARTVVSYTDGHVKSVNSGTLYPKGVRTSRWVGGAADNTGWSRE